MTPGGGGPATWMEITNRRDIGVNLNAPAGDKNGAPNWSYDSLRAVRAGDVVYHYDSNRQAIVGSSVAVGEPWMDQVFWAARGTRSRDIKPHLQSGWYLGLEGYAPLAEPVSRKALTERRGELLALRDRLAAIGGGAVKFPFIAYRDEIRAFQAYLTRFPPDLIELFPSLARATVLRELEELGGVAYRIADETTSVGERDPFAVNPALVERALRGHARTQNGLARHVQARGAMPMSPAPGHPNYDLAWRVGERLYVAEVKSRTDDNEERQLRLGLGQVLRYRQMLAELGEKDPRAVLALESRPRDRSWLALCASLGVILCWGPAYEGLGA